MMIYLATLGITIAVELAIVAGASRRLGSLRGKPMVATCVCVNMLTHPLATMARVTFGVALLPIEASVYVAESIGYRKIAQVRWATSIGLSCTANSVSMLLGLIFF